MNPRALDLKHFDRSQSQVKKDVFVPALIKALQRLANTIIVNALDVRAIQTEGVFVQRRQPGGDLVHRRGRGQNIVDQNAEALLNGQLDPLVL